MAPALDATSDAPDVTDRRTRRRRETIDEILAIAVDVMTEDGVNGLRLSEVARRLGVKPPSLYKYFDSLHAVYNELFLRGQLEHLEVMRAATATAPPGLAALRAGLDASGRWCLQNRAVAQLLFWRPVPSFEPSPDAFDPSEAMVDLERRCVADAIAAGELGARAAHADDAVYLASTLLTGVLSQALANEPGLRWGEGRFTPMFPRLLDMLPTLYPATSGNRSARSRSARTR